MDHDSRISRRELLRGRFLGGFLNGLRTEVPKHTSLSDHWMHSTADESIGAPVDRRQTFPLLRPPGAIEESQFLHVCTRCNDCISACPHHAIVQAPIRYRQAAGTPMIDPIQSPCMMCPDMPCIAACESGALRPDVPVLMGTARIDTTTCLAHQRSFCTVCSEHCPVPCAIELSEGKPRINESKCTGCGVCQHVCPAPENAILLMPTLDRPTIAES